MSKSVKLSDGSYIDASAVWDATGLSNVQTTLNQLQRYSFIQGENKVLCLDATPIIGNHRTWFVICEKFSSSGNATGASLFFVSTDYSRKGYLFDIAGSTTAQAGISIATNDNTIEVTFSGWNVIRAYPII